MPDCSDSPFLVAEASGTYTTTRPVTADEVIAFSKLLVAEKHPRGTTFTNHTDVGNFFIVRYAGQLREVFSCLFLDNKHRLLACEDLFFGTLNGASVHPRIVAQRALALNAGAIVIAHCHPSGVAEPSRADHAITKRIALALSLMDVELLDHIVVGGDTAVSFAYRGEMPVVSFPD